MSTERARDWLSGIVDRAENWGPIAAAGYYLVLAAFGLAALFVLAAIFGWVEQRVTVDVGGLVGGILAAIAAIAVIQYERGKEERIARAASDAAAIRLLAEMERDYRVIIKLFELSALEVMYTRWENHPVNLDEIRIIDRKINEGDIKETLQRLAKNETCLWDHYVIEKLEKEVMSLYLHVMVAISTCAKEIPLLNSQNFDEDEEFVERWHWITNIVKYFVEGKNILLIGRKGIPSLVGQRMGRLDKFAQINDVPDFETADDLRFWVSELAEPCRCTNRSR
jgi:hypothetical protein